MEYFNLNAPQQQEPSVSFEMFLAIFGTVFFVIGWVIAFITTNSGINRKLENINAMLVTQDQIINDHFVELVQILEKIDRHTDKVFDNNNYIAVPSTNQAVVPRQLPDNAPDIPPRKSKRLAMFKNNKVGQIIVSRGANDYFLDADLIFEIEFNDGTLETIKMEQLGTNATMQEFSDPKWTERSIKRITLTRMYPDEKQYLKGLTVSILNTDNELVRELTVDHELWTELEFVV